MDYRTLGRTGMQVSPLCLGAMMFGAWGNPDHDDVDPHHPPRARRRHQLHRHRRRLLARRVGGDRRQGARGRAPRRRGARHQGPRHDGRRTRTSAGNSRRWIVREVEHSLRRLRTDWIDLYQIHRPEPDTDVEETLGALTDLVRAGKIRCVRQLDLPGAARSSRRSGRRARAGSGALRDRAAALLDAGARRSSATCCRRAERYGMGVIPWSPLARRLADRALAQGAGGAVEPRAAARIPARYDLALPGEPAQARRGRGARAARRRGRTSR